MNKKTEKFHEMKLEELVQELKELKERLFRLRFSHATGQLANPLEMASCKKDIARVLTILKQLNSKGEKIVAPVKAVSTKTAKKEKVAK